ncbi:uncharacterized protein LOC109863491 [Pseudomyrmex gracilis]|uniref:uncharacterized protein LOC109863491 n=1 Tax=Pseudomyrmex gracilis TaxID=219809 RepID=UPI000995A7E4|nr:uncharacterized protein LOC109863491 [Pseudomyrmex gracilis]
MTEETADVDMPVAEFPPGKNLTPPLNDQTTAPGASPGGGRAVREVFPAGSPSCSLASTGPAGVRSSRKRDGAGPSPLLKRTFSAMSSVQRQLTLNRYHRDSRGPFMVHVETCRPLPSSAGGDEQEGSKGLDTGEDANRFVEAFRDVADKITPCEQWTAHVPSFRVVKQFVLKGVDEEETVEELLAGFGPPLWVGTGVGSPFRSC